MDADYAWRLSKFARLTSRHLRYDDDFVDRLNYQYTGILLFIFIGVIGIRQYAGKPIQCWTPQEFTRSWEEYAENYCWVASTYFLNFGTAPLPVMIPAENDVYPVGAYLIPMDIRSASLTRRQSVRKIDPAEQPASGRFINYYQWAPILLALQSLMCCVPCLAWRLLTPRSGFNLRRVMQLASEAASSAPSELPTDYQSKMQSAYTSSCTPTESIRLLARYINMCLTRRREHQFVDVYKNLFIPRESASSKNTADSMCHSKINDGSVQERASNHDLGHPVDIPSLFPSKRVKTNRFDKLSYKCIFTCYPCAERFSRSSDRTSHVHSDKPGTSPDEIRDQIIRQPRLARHFFGNKNKFLVRLHILVKILYLINAIGQIFLLEYYTGVQYNFYGIRVLYDLSKGRQWEESGHFPRVTFCDFEARKLAQSHYYTLQCVLPINMFLEKIYIFLWLWFFFVALATFIDLLSWISRIGSHSCRVNYVRYNLLNIHQHSHNLKQVEPFVENYLGSDGVFIIRLIAQNYGELVASDLVGELWICYQKRRHMFENVFEKNCESYSILDSECLSVTRNIGNENINKLSMDFEGKIVRKSVVPTAPQAPITKISLQQSNENLGQVEMVKYPSTRFSKSPYNLARVRGRGQADSLPMLHRIHSDLILQCVSDTGSTHPYSGSNQFAKICCTQSKENETLNAVPNIYKPQENDFQPKTGWYLSDRTRDIGGSELLYIDNTSNDKELLDDHIV